MHSRVSRRDPHNRSFYIRALTTCACSAALRFEDAFIEFIKSGEQRMVIDESLTGFGVRLVSTHACEFYEA